MVCSFTPGGNWVCMASTVRIKPSTVSMVFSSCDFCTDSSSVRSPLYSAMFSNSCAPSLTRATCDKRTMLPALRATMMLAKSSGRSMRPCTCTTRSCCKERMEPTGRSWFSLETASTTCCALMPSASMACGFRYKLISRLVPPTKVTEPTPRTFSMRFFNT